MWHLRSLTGNFTPATAPALWLHYTDIAAQKPKPMGGHPRHSKDKPCLLGIMQKKVTIPVQG